MGRLVLAQSLERSLPDIAAVGKAREFDFGDELRLQPVHVAGFARRVLAAERALIRSLGLQRRHDAPDGILPEAGADHPDKGQMIAAIDAGHQRAEFAVGGLPAPQHDLLSGTGFCLGPALRAARTIGRAELLGNDPLKRQFRRRLQDRVPVSLEMLDIADRFGFGPRVQHFLQSRFALPKRQAAKIFAVRKQQVEGKEDQMIGLAVGYRRLQRGKIRRAMVVERNDLAIDEPIRQRARLFRDSGELVGPVQAFAGLEPGLAALDTQLHAVAVEFDLVAPIFSARWPIDRRAELWRDEIRHRGDFPCPSAAFAGAAGDVTASLRFECHTASALARLDFAIMNGFGALPLPAAI